MKRFSPQLLRAARRAAGLRPEFLAVKIGRSVYTLAAYEGGRFAPRADALGALVSALGCQVDDFFETVPAGAEVAA